MRLPKDRPRDQIAVNVPAIAITIPNGGAKWWRNIAATPEATPTARAAINLI